MTRINLLAALLDRYGRRESVAEFRRRALQEAFWRVRRDVWDARESRLRAHWEGYG